MRNSRVMVRITGKRSQRRGRRRESCQEVSRSIVFWGLQAGGQKGVARSSRKRVIPLM
jgi:hypothetical protein